MKKTSLLSPTLGALVCLTQAALAQAPAQPAPAAAKPAEAAPAPTAQPATTSAAVTATDAEATTTSAEAAPEPTAGATETGEPEDMPPPPLTDEPAEATPLEAKAEAAPPAAATVPKLPYMKRYLPEGNMWELGLFGGVMFPSSQHQLFDATLGTGVQRPFNTAGELGVRVAYFPMAFIGVEMEAAAMPTSVDVGTDPVSSSGGLWSIRGQIVGQYPGLSVTPFAVVGFGALGASSDAMGNDVDDAWHFGVGVKVPIDEHLTARLDLRDTVHRQVNASSGTGTHSPEILIGLTFVPKRKKPDFDADGYVDYSDECPAVAGSGDDCPPPDGDGDTVADEKDECADVAGIAPTGCPDQDGDGVLDKVDPCPKDKGPAPSGCPEKECPVADTDGDGITDVADQCPADPAATFSGCAVKDADGDTIQDDVDQCPADPETKNGVADDDGCPEVEEPPAAPGKPGAKPTAAAPPAKPATATATAPTTGTAKPAAAAPAKPTP